MMQQRTLMIWLMAFATCAAAVAYSFARLDVPIALFVAKLGLFLRPLNGALGGGVLLSGETAVLFGISVVRLVRGRISPFWMTTAIACLASIVAYGINDHVLKVFFGVPGPLAVLGGAGHYFHFWAGSQSSSFPSGHMVLAAAFAGVFMRLSRASIRTFAALLLVAAALLIAGDWHFLSDIIAGTFLGVLAGTLAGAALSIRART